MKRFLLILSVLLSFQACARTSGNTVTTPKMTTVISECRQYEGVETIILGRFATSALRGVIRVSGGGDSDVKDALSLIKGIRGISIMEYDDCSSDDKAEITRIIRQALSEREVLLEASDEGDKIELYGKVDDNGDMVRDFVLYSSSECALICINGAISMETVARIASND